MTNYPRTFLKAAAWILTAEGGYVDHPLDAGSATNYGVSLRYLKAKGKAGDINGDAVVDTHDIRCLSEARATKLYYHDFWLACRCDGIPFPIALVLFDMAVNSGPKKAAMCLQSEVNAKMDGIIGPKTIRAVMRYNIRDLTLHFLSRRAEHYHHIVRGNTSQAVFHRGWLNRLFHLQQFINDQKTR